MIHLVSGCKINLGLHIKGLRADGFHDLQSLFYPLKAPCDHIFIEINKNQHKPLILSSNFNDNGSNILNAVYDAFGSGTGCHTPLKINLKKNVPVGAGLGGGSANAAAFLEWLNSFHGSPLTTGEMHKMAAAIGSDVPFFLHNTPCLVSGRGEYVLPVNFKAYGLYILLAAPAIKIFTKEIFKRWDKDHPNEIALTISCNADRNFLPVQDLHTYLDIAHLDMKNDLEETVYKYWPELSSIKESFLKNGSLYTAMSGSGAAHFGIFSDKQVCKTVAAHLRRQNIKAYCIPMHDFGA